MMRSERLGLLASAVALALACGSTAWAETQATSQSPAAETTTATADKTEAAAPVDGDPRAAGRARMEQRHAEAMAERDRRYAELRERAAEVGLDLPETPPWEQSMPQPPQMPEMPGMPQPPAMPQMPTEMPGMAAPERMTRADWDKQRDERYAKLREQAAEKGIELPEKPLWQRPSPAERRAYMETMRELTTEQRRTLHELRWEAMRDRAAERGMELPESPPWEQMMKEREAMQARWKAYRETVAAMTDEQREAAAAVYGSPFGLDDDGFTPGPSGRPYPPMMPPRGGPDYDQGMAPFQPDYRRGPTPPYGSGY
ncbi:hypothetical protein Thimo_1204 [Thioflavicoccus mobilis 8321]|uniref:DUF3106 domain-containing protein n=1 Tax=Thioflavicoccus mobilis 8321 TaxID=765912 RepID=L0GW08_9GAMM|nr:hypothetical protein [Thioflavicoccus mobilis]AGA90002.1 hypothetical protein Thimo_1204 [Thioflavicoccus mobilis 8321]